MATSNLGVENIDLSVIDALFDEATNLLYNTKDPRGRNPKLRDAFAQLMNNLKSSMTSNDRQLILVYFRWLTRRGAKRMGITSLTRTTALTEETMNWLKSEGLADVVDWQFTGMTYHGANSGVCCSHGGHRLQYAYHAYSPSAKKSLIFGSQCGSEFFQVDLASLGKLNSLVDNAKHELAFILARGRMPESLAHSEILNTFNVMRRFPDLARYCVQYTGQSTFELVSNFISCGFYPPASLTSSFMDGYYAAVRMFLQSKGVPSDILAICDETRQNEITVSVDGYRHNTGVVPNNMFDKPHEFLYPLSSAGFSDAIKASFILEAYFPSVFSGYYNFFDCYSKFCKLSAKAKAFNYKKTNATARLIYNYSFKAGECPFKDVNSVIAYALLSDDLRIALYMLGLTPNSHRLCNDSLQVADLKALDMFANAKQSKTRFMSNDKEDLQLETAPDVSSLKDAKNLVNEESAFDVDFDEQDIEIMQSSALRAVSANGARENAPRFGVYRDCRYRNEISVKIPGSSASGYYIPNVFDYCWLSDNLQGDSATRVAYSMNPPKRELLLTYIMQNFDDIEKALSTVAGITLGNNSKLFASEVGITNDTWNKTQEEMDMDSEFDDFSDEDEQPANEMDNSDADAYDVDESDFDDADFDELDDEDMDLDSDGGEE